MVFKNVTPILFSKDISRSLQFYTTVFGFDRSWHFGNPPDFGAVIKDSVEVFFSTGGQSNPGFCIYLVVDDIDTLHKRIVDNGGKVLSPPANYE